MTSFKEREREGKRRLDPRLKLWEEKDAGDLILCNVEGRIKKASESRTQIGREREEHECLY